jgi:16S rRNA (guanine966-N2)-methyltransferase
MRIITGKYKGRKLVEARHLKDLRPTTDANRESLFNILSSSKIIKETGFELQNCDLLDAFCGTGAVSFEALSRGVKSATLIDKNRDHLEIAKQNATILKENNVQYFCCDLNHKTPKSQKQHNLIFIDPPYSKNLAATAFENLSNTGWVANNALIIIEHSFLENLQSLENKLELLEQRKYKETLFSFYHHTVIPAKAGIS